MEYTKFGKILVHLDSEGKEIETNEILNVIEPMNDPRHNHLIFEIDAQAKNTYDFIVIGGQYTNLNDGVSTILSSCERYY